MMTVGDVAALLQLPNDDSWVNLASFGKAYNRRAREVWLDVFHETVKLLLRNEPFGCLLVGALLILRHTSLCIITHELLVQTVFAFDDVRELVQEREPEPIYSIVPK